VIVGAHDDPFLLRKSSADCNFLVSRRTDAHFIECLGRVIEQAEIDLVIPTTDPDVRVIGEVRDQLACQTFLPRQPVIELCQDKFALTTFLRARGIPAPETCAVTDLESIEGLVAKLGRDARFWCRIRTGAGSRGAAPVASATQARAWISYWNVMRGVPPSAFTLSEYLPGRDFACQSLWKDGRLVLIKTTERVAYFGGAGTPSGVSSIGAIHKTVREPRVAEVSAAAVRALEPRSTGAFSVDLKEDDDGVPCVTEINVGRLLSGTTIFDLTGRHNMAATYVRLALDQPVAIDDPYDAVSDFYMVRDLDTLPDVFHGDALLDGVEDARGGHPRKETTWVTHPKTAGSSA
jgi:carbamoyl-phosphate synthase large subunit